MYDQNYSAWKNWAGNNMGASFGDFTVYEASYYNKLLKLCSVQQDANLLEVGFGNGGFLSFCRGLGIQIQGTEANLTLVQHALQQGFIARVAEDMGRLPAASFDAIISLDVIEHIEPNETASFLQSCLRLLKPGGRLLLRFPNGDSPFSISNFNADITHKNWISAEKLKYYASNAAVSDIRIMGTPQIVMTRSLRHALYNLINLPIKFLINQIYRMIFYPGRKLNFVSVDLVAVLTK